MDKAHRIARQMIETAGQAAQTLGMGRTVGQIFAFLYLSEHPTTLTDITRSLGISKGSASIGVRQLELWDAVEKVWVRGQRSDHYRANDSLGRIFRNAILDLVRRKVKNSAALIEETELQFRDRSDGALTDEERFVRERINKLRSFQQKAENVWESFVVRMLTGQKERNK